MNLKNFPTDEELRQWWKREQEFMDTPFGRQWYATRAEAERLWREHQAYQKHILEDATLRPLPPVMVKL